MIKYTQFITTIIGLMLPILAIAQNGTVNGRVIDADSKEAIPFANVALLKGSTPAKGAITDGEGYFKIEQVELGTYKIAASFLGYEQKTIEDVLLSKSNRAINVGQIALQVSAIGLESVEVKAMQQTVVSKIDRRTYKASEFSTAKGGNAADVLNKLPSVSVGPDGEVSVRGTSNFMVYLNGRPTQMEPSVLLGQIRGEAIESIDVITVPTAKYDAQGKGGIINISTKKNALKGVSIAANGLVGGAPYNNLTDPISQFKQNDNRFGSGFSLMYSKENLLLYGGASYNKRNVNGLRTGDARILQEDDSFYHMLATGERPEWYVNYSGNVGLDYNLSHKSKLSLSYYYGNRQEGRSAFYVYNNFYANKNKQPIEGTALLNEYVYNPNTDNRYGEFHTSNIDFSTKFHDKSILKLSFLYEYSALSRELDNEDYEFNYQDKVAGNKRRHFQQSDSAPLNGYRFSADYEKQFDNNHVLSIGAQPQYVSHNNIFNYDTLNVANEEWGIYSDLTNLIKLTRGVYASYIDYSAQWNKLSIITGMRLEYTKQKMKVDNPNYFTIFDRETASEYNTEQFDWFPTLHANYAISEKDELTLAASRRINRPATKDMAPFLYRRHYEVYLVGDPSLEAEYLNNLELSYGKLMGKQKVTLTGFYRGTSNAVFRVNTIYKNNELENLDPDHNKVLVRSYTNAGNTTALGAELNANFNAGNKLNFFLGGSLYHYNVNGDVFGYRENNSSANWNLKGNVNWYIINALKFTADFDFKSATVTAQGQNEMFYMSNLALNYAPPKLKGCDFSFRVLDILASNDKGLSTRAYNAESVEIFHQTTQYHRQGPILELGINYSLNFEGSKKKNAGVFGNKQF